MQPYIKNTVRRACDALIKPALPATVVDDLASSFDAQKRPHRLLHDLCDYLWEHHVEELITHTRFELERSVERFATEEGRES